MILVPIVIRPGVTVQVRLPADLTQSEGERIARVVMSYVDADGVFSAPKPTWEAYAKAMGLAA